MNRKKQKSRQACHHDNTINSEIIQPIIGYYIDFAGISRKFLNQVCSSFTGDTKSKHIKVAITIMNKIKPNWFTVMIFRAFNLSSLVKHVPLTVRWMGKCKFAVAFTEWFRTAILTIFFLFYVIVSYLFSFIL